MRGEIELLNQALPIALFQIFTSCSWNCINIRFYLEEYVHLEFMLFLQLLSHRC